MRKFSIFFLRLLYPKSSGQVCQITHSSIRGGWLLSSNSVICNGIIWQCTDYGLVHTASIVNCQSSAVWMVLCIPPCQSSVSTTGPCRVWFWFFCHGTGLEVRFVQSSQHHTGSSVRHMYTFPDKQTAVIASSTDNMSITTGKSNIRHMGRMT